MAQKTWSYADNFGIQYSIGLYHGASSGHVVVYCNDRIMVIDFGIKEDKTYSFFIGEEFFELGLKRKLANEYSYDLSINKDAETPLNRIRNQKVNHYTWQACVLGFFFLGSIALTTYFLLT